MLQSEKNFLWEIINAQFDFPEGCSLEDVETQIIAKMGKAWKTFKSEMYNTYVKQDLIPNYIAYGYLADQRAEFVARCQSQEFQQ